MLKFKMSVKRPNNGKHSKDVRYDEACKDYPKHCPKCVYTTCRFKPINKGVDDV